MFYQIASYLIFYIFVFNYIIWLIVIILIFKTSIQPMWKQWVQVEIWGFICMTFDYLQHIIPHDLKWNLSAWDSESISYQQVQLYTQHDLILVSIIVSLWFLELWIMVPFIYKCPTWSKSLLSVFGRI